LARALRGNATRSNVHGRRDEDEPETVDWNSTLENTQRNTMRNARDCYDVRC